MRKTLAALALGTIVVLCSLAPLITPACAKKGKVAHKPLTRIIITRQLPAPYWDSNLVPRYRYRPQDDRVDPYGPPVVPVVRYNDGGWL
jgi:hypothetical protein